ncbi:LCP family protein [Bacillaceae bacterium Marseille-Q3522]|nr:LCP family protein [Bacillaceae bacterium Marseille-Q3522]
MKKEKSKKKRTWLRVVSIVLLLLVVGAGIFVYSIYHNTRQTVEKMQHETPSIDTAVGEKKLNKQETINVLLLGVDERQGDAGRSDALMVMALDPQHESMKIVSIPRDTRTEIAGRGTMDKINHAYAFGGVDMSIDTVENFLNIEMDYYLRMNMEGLSELVDAVGGITVDNQSDWYDEGYYQKGFHYKKGSITLNGPQTMGYVRMRHMDSDFARTGRQRQVIQAIIEKGASIVSITRINDILQTLGNNIQTNMDFSVMTNLFQNYRSALNNQENYMLQGSGTTIDGIYYYQVPEEEVTKVHDMLAGES